MWNMSESCRFRYTVETCLTIISFVIIFFLSVAGNLAVIIIFVKVKIFLLFFILSYKFIKQRINKRLEFDRAQRFVLPYVLIDSCNSNDVAAMLIKISSSEVNFKLI